MARIVKLAEVLPEDIAFEMPDGKQFVVPGDPPLELILTIAHLFEQAQNGAEAKADEVGLDILERLDKEVVGLLQMRDAEIKASPFGVIGVQHFVAELLQAYNFAEAEEVPPTKTTRKASRSRKSPRSNGSPSS